LIPDVSLLTVLGLLDHEKYADDGLLFDLIEDFEPEELNSEEAGVYLKLESSGWVKNSKGWLKELSFIGLIFNGFRMNYEVQLTKEIV